MNETIPVTDGEQPNYINYGGNFPVQPPYVLDRTSLYGFAFESDCTKLQAILDNRLNGLDSERRYVPFTSKILILFTDMPHAYSATEIDQGFVAMSEASFWVLAVEQTKNRAGKWQSERLVWFIPYIFANKPFQMTSGREVIGYPKALADISMPKDVHYANSFTVNPASYIQFRQTSECLDNRLFSLTNNSDNPNTATLKQEAYEMANATADVTSYLQNLSICPDAIGGPLDVLRLIENFLSEDLPNLEMPGIFLKQFRSAKNDGKACYQALIESPFQINNFYDIRFLDSSEYSLTINDLASFPVASDLGLETGQKPTDAIWVNLTFTNKSGEELWEATY